MNRWSDDTYLVSSENSDNNNSHCTDDYDPSSADDDTEYRQTNGVGGLFNSSDVGQNQSDVHKANFVKSTTGPNILRKTKPSKDMREMSRTELRRVYGFGYNLITKMGYDGSGGICENSLVTPIGVERRVKNQGLGMDTFHSFRGKFKGRKTSASQSVPRHKFGIGVSTEECFDLSKSDGTTENDEEMDDNVILIDSGSSVSHGNAVPFIRAVTRARDNEENTVRGLFSDLLFNVSAMIKKENSAILDLQTQRDEKSRDLVRLKAEFDSSEEAVSSAEESISHINVLEYIVPQMCFSFVPANLVANHLTSGAGHLYHKHVTDEMMSAQSFDHSSVKVTCVKFIEEIESNVSVMRNEFQSTKVSRCVWLVFGMEQFLSDIAVHSTRQRLKGVTDITEFERVLFSLTEIVADDKCLPRAIYLAISTPFSELFQKEITPQWIDFITSLIDNFPLMNSDAKTMSDVMSDYTPKYRSEADIHVSHVLDFYETFAPNNSYPITNKNENLSGLFGKVRIITKTEDHFHDFLSVTLLRTLCEVVRTLVTHYFPTNVVIDDDGTIDLTYPVTRDDNHTRKETPSLQSGVKNQHLCIISIMLSGLYVMLKPWFTILPKVSVHSVFSTIKCVLLLDPYLDLVWEHWMTPFHGRDLKFKNYTSLHSIIDDLRERVKINFHHKIGVISIEDIDKVEKVLKEIISRPASLFSIEEISMIVNERLLTWQLETWIKKKVTTIRKNNSAEKDKENSCHSKLAQSKLGNSSNITNQTHKAENVANKWKRDKYETLYASYEDVSECHTEHGLGNRDNGLRNNMSIPSASKTNTFDFPEFSLSHRNEITYVVNILGTYIVLLDQLHCFPDIRETFLRCIYSVKINILRDRTPLRSFGVDTGKKKERTEKYNIDPAGIPSNTVMVSLLDVIIDQYPDALVFPIHGATLNNRPLYRFVRADKKLTFLWSGNILYAKIGGWNNTSEMSDFTLIEANKLHTLQL